VDCYQPSRHEVDKVVEHVGIRDSIDGSVNGDAEKEDTSKVTKTSRYSWYHFATRQSLNEKDKGHDREDIVVRRKRSEPVNG
jgi:hypothetical protein